MDSTGVEPRTSWLRVRRSNHWATEEPHLTKALKLYLKENQIHKIKMSGLGPDTDECQRSRRPGMGTYTVALRGLGQKSVVRCPDFIFIGDLYGVPIAKQVLALPLVL